MNLIKIATSVLSQQYLYKVFRFSPRLNLQSQST